MELDYDGLLEAYNLRIEECMYKGKRIEELEEENKNLKEEVKKWKMVANENGTHYDMLEEENRKLKSENEELQEYKSMYEGLC